MRLVLDMRFGDSVNALHCIYYDGTNWNTLEDAVDYAGTGWHHVAFAVDTTNHVQTAYVDGAVVAADCFSTAITYVVTRDYTTWGMHPRHDRFGLNGILDEIEVSDTPRSASWIKLAYENQRPDGQTLVVFP